VIPFTFTGKGTGTFRTHYPRAVICANTNPSPLEYPTMKPNGPSRRTLLGGLFAGLFAFFSSPKTAVAAPCPQPVPPPMPVLGHVDSPFGTTTTFSYSSADLSRLTSYLDAPGGTTTFTYIGKRPHESSE